MRDQRNHEVGLWGHIWRKGTPKPALMTVIQTFTLTEGDMNDEDIAFALFNSALVYSERQSCPLLGVSTLIDVVCIMCRKFSQKTISKRLCASFVDANMCAARVSICLVHGLRRVELNGELMSKAFFNVSWERPRIRPSAQTTCHPNVSRIILGML